MARIGIAGFLHETNTFAKRPATLEAFAIADAWPGLLVGPELPPAVEGMNLAIAGFIEAARGAGHRLIPLVWTSANPSGLVTRDAYEHVWSLLEHELATAGPLDALFLDLHGAMVAEHVEDGEGELLQRLRGRIGGHVPIIAALDFHANISPRMVELADALIVYRTYPHVDMADTGRRAAQLMQHLLGGNRLHKAYRQLPFLIPLVSQCTLEAPFDRLNALAKRHENEAVLSTSIAPGFPLADTHDTGPTVLAYGTDAAAVEIAADDLSAALAQARPALSARLYNPAEAIEFALTSEGSGPVILADTEDNPGGGSEGDTTDILHELVRRQAPGACVGILCDPSAAAAAHRAGLGATVELALGGHGGIGAPPLKARFLVQALGDGRFSGTGPFYLGCRMDLGPMALLRYLGEQESATAAEGAADGATGIRILVSSNKQQAADQAMFRHLGVEPRAQRILVLKSSVHFRADFGPIAREILTVAAAGENVADIGRLRYRRLRPGVAIR